MGADEIEEFEEWRVTGDPGHNFPYYGFTWSPDVNPQLGDPETAARAFIARIAEHPTEWVDGPRLSMRRVKRSKWQQVES